MAKFPYIQNPADLKRFLQEKIPSVGVPTDSKVDATYLLSVGARKGSVGRLRAVLEALGFIDSSGVPTHRWKACRSAGQAPTELGLAMREAYPELFQTYSDACQRSAEQQTDFFKSNTDLADTTVGYTVRTFRTLCQLAHFGPAEGAQISPAQPVTITVEPGATKKAPQRELQPVVRGRQGLTINVNIQLTLPSDIEDHDLYDRFFASLKKHLLT